METTTNRNNMLLVEYIWLTRLDEQKHCVAIIEENEEEPVAATCTIWILEICTIGCAAALLQDERKWDLLHQA